MTPTEQDKELDKILDALIDSVVEARMKWHKQSQRARQDQSSNSGFMQYQSELNDAYNTAKNAIKQLITADRKRVALEARIDEIKLTKDNSEESYLGEDWWADESIKDNSAHEVPLSYFENRIAELKAQQEEK